MTPESMETTVASPVRGFLGAALIAIGALIMLLCGGCGALFFVAFLVDTLAHPNDAAMLLMPLVLGGVPAAVGLGLFVVGRGLRRPRHVPPENPAP